MLAKKKRPQSSETGEKRALLGKAEIPSVDIKEHMSFIHTVNEMATVQVARQIEELQRKTDAMDRESAKIRARREFYEKILFALPITTPSLNPITRPLENAVEAIHDYISMKRKAHADAKEVKALVNEDRIDNENKERLNRLNNAMIPFVFSTKGSSEIEEESQFSFYRVTSQKNHGTNFRNDDMQLHEGCGVHYVAVNKPKYEAHVNPNIVVMSLWDSGRIEIRGNCDSYKEKMHVEAARRGNYRDCSNMDQMLWDDINRVLIFKAKNRSMYKHPTHEPYLGFSRNAESLTCRTKDRVVHKAKVTFFRMLRSQGMYAKQNQPMEYINI